MNKSRNHRSRKAKAQPQGATDECHSTQSPACSLAKQVTVDVIPEASEILEVRVAPESSTLLGRMIRNHLLSEFKTQTTGGTVSNSKKKRRKKKRKGGRSSPVPSNGGTNGISSGEGPAVESAPLKTPKQPEMQAPIHASSTAMDPNEQHTATLVNTVPLNKEVQHWLRKLVSEDVDMSTIPNRSLESFMGYLVAKTPTIDLTEVSFHMKDVACSACKAQAEAYWQSTGIPGHELGIITGKDQGDRRYELHPKLLESKSQKSSTCIPIMGTDDWSMDRAYDYRALEEGFAYDKPREDAFSLHSVVDKDTTKPVSLEMRGAPFDTAGVERLLRDMILPCGLPEVEEHNAYILSDEEFNALCEDVKAKEDPILSELQELRKNRDALMDDVKEALSCVSVQTFEPHQTNRLRQADAASDNLLDAILTMLLTLTTYFQGIHGDTKWALSRMQQLWRSYSECIERALKALLGHEGTLLQLATRPGVIPPQFVHVGHRRSYSNLVDAKLHSISDLLTQVALIMNDDADEDGVPFLRRLITVESFSATISNAKTKRNGKSTSKLDETCRALLLKYNELTKPVIQCTNISQVLETEEERCQELLTKLGEVNQLIVKEFKDTLEGKLQNIDTSLWHDLRKQYREISSRSIEPQDPDEWDDVIENHDRSNKSGALALERNRLAELTSVAASQWLCMRVMQSSTSGPLPTMPLRLKKRMAQQANEEASSIFRDGEDSCEGNGSERRVACILSCLLYKWLQERCNEWNAELTQKELLESMDGDTQLGSCDVFDSGASKTSRSKKKKKKKGAPAEKENGSAHSFPKDINDNGEKGTKPSLESDGPHKNGTSNNPVQSLIVLLESREDENAGSSLGEHHGGNWVTVGPKDSPSQAKITKQEEASVTEETAPSTQEVQKPLPTAVAALDIEELDQTPEMRLPNPLEADECGVEETKEELEHDDLESESHQTGDEEEKTIVKEDDPQESVKDVTVVLKGRNGTLSAEEFLVARLESAFSSGGVVLL